MRASTIEIEHTDHTDQKLHARCRVSFPELIHGGSFRMKQSAAVNATCKAAHHPINGPPRRCPTKSSCSASWPIWPTQKHCMALENVLHADSLTHIAIYRGLTWGESRDYVPGRCQRKPVVQSCPTMEEGRQPHRYPRGSVHHSRRCAVGRSWGMCGCARKSTSKLPSMRILGTTTSATHFISC